MGARAALAASALPKDTVPVGRSASPRAPAPALSAARAGAPAQFPPAAGADSKGRSEPRATPLLFLSVFGLSALLAFSVFGLRFDAWSLLPQLRPGYEVACEVIGCRLPSPNMPAAWDFQAKAVVRPGAPEPLVLDVELTNNAPYRQSLPTVAVRFTNDAGELIAEERLTPRDYTDRPAQRMTPGKPKSLQLRFPAPGADASRYQISLL